MTRRVALLAATALVVSLAAAAAVAPFHQAAPPVEHVTDDRLVQPAANGTALWPYTSRSRSVEGRTLALNLVVVGEPDAVRRTLTRRTDRDWERATGHARVELAADSLHWRSARGSARYTYTRPADGAGAWVQPAYQLQSGTYFGSRLHVRAYPAPGGEWTALQVHGEHWDWFRLRHTVTSVAAAGERVERDLRPEPAVRAVRQQEHGLTGGGSPGWLTVVEFAAVAGAVAVTGRVAGTGRRRLHPRHLVLPTAIAGVYLGVRAMGIAVETAVPAAPPKAVMALLYPVLVAGVPFAAVRFSRSFGPVRVVSSGALVAALLAAMGFLAALAIDAAALDLARLTGRLLLHRLTLAVALGTIAAGAAGEDRRLLGVGVAGWLLGLAAPLVGVV